MKRILLVSNYVFHYRMAIYDYFYEEFEKIGYEFHVLSNEYQDVEHECKFIKHEKKFSMVGYVEKVGNISPDVMISFLHLRDGLIFPLTVYCKYKRIPMIYWNHGVNLSKANSSIRKIIYKIIHGMSDAIILYTPNELRYISRKSQKKVFIAYNTLCFDGIDKESVLGKQEVKKRYSINEEKIILFISRILPYKELDVLLDNFREEYDIGLVVVGPGINDRQLGIINETPHYYYLGAKYGKEVDEIYNMGDIYSTPGHIGLALIQALFWGKPIVVLNNRHAPEIYYLDSGKNGYIVSSEQELKEKILFLLNNVDVYREFSQNAIKTISGPANIEKMFEGFCKAIAHCMNKKLS